MKLSNTNLGFSLAVFAPECDLTFGPFASLLVENGARVERRTVQMQRDSDIRVARVFNPVEPKVIVDVAHSIGLHGGPGGFLQFLAIVLDFPRSIAVPNVGLAVFVDRLVLGPSETHLGQLSLEHLHEAVRVGVVVDGRSMAFVPTKDHQVEFSIASIN